MMRWRTFVLLIVLAVLSGDGAWAGRRAILGGRAAPVADGPNVYYDTTTTLNGWVAIGASFTEWDSVTVAAAGTVTKLRFRARGGLSDQTVKIGIYDNSNNLLGSGTSATIVNGSGETWYEVVLGVGVPVSAATYKLAISSTGAVDIRVNTSGVGNYAAVAYASFPPSTLPAPDGTLGTTFVMGCYVD